MQSGTYRLKDFSGSSHRILAAWAEGLPAGARVLEIGVGANPFVQLVPRKDLYWCGIDATPASLGAMRGLLSAGVIADAEQLTRLLPRCDAIILADTLEHLVDPERMLRLASSALRPHGSVFLSVPNVAHGSVRLSLLGGRFPYADRGILDRTHRTFFTRRSLRGMLEANGYAVVREAFSSVPLPFAMPRAPRAVMILLERLQRAAIAILPGLFAYQLLVEARVRASDAAVSRPTA